MSISCPQAVQDFLNNWQQDPLQAKEAFTDFQGFLASRPGVSLDFKARPGVSYSLRARHESQQKRELFVLVDVVDDEPENRWLSVCSYADMISDPDELGDYVPEGLMGEDACCFNLDGDDPSMRGYIAARLAEAAQAAAAGA